MAWLPVGTIDEYRTAISLDLDTLTASGEGQFDPAAPAVRLSLGVGRDASGSGWPIATGLVLDVDNVSYDSPAFYVSPAGSDTNDGRTEKTAFAHPQTALDAAIPGAQPHGANQRELRRSRAPRQ